MKKLIITFLIITVLLTGFSFANKYSEQDGIELYEYNPTTETSEVDFYKSINFMFKGQDVITDIPGILYQKGNESRTLIPIYFIKDYLGAEVNWYQDTQEVEIINDDKRIILKIGSPYAYVNGEKKELPSKVPARLMYKIERGEKVWRTMVPARFLTENLGYEIGWIGETTTVYVNSPEQDITGMSFEHNYFNEKKNFPELRIKTTGKVDVTSHQIGDKNLDINQKVIFDIPNANLKLDNFQESKFLNIENGKVNYLVDLYKIKDLTMYQAEGDMKSVRMELNLEGKKGYNVVYDEDAQELVIQFINSVNKIETKDIYNSKALIIYNDEDQPSVNQIYDWANNSIHFDLINSISKISDDESNLNVSSGGIDSVTTRELTASEKEKVGYSIYDKVTRITLNVNKDKKLENVYTELEDNKIYAFVSGYPLDGFEYAKIDMANSNININFLKEGNYEYEYDKNRNRVKLIFQDDLLDIEELNLNIDDNIVKNIDVNKANGYNYIEFELTNDTVAVENTNSRDTNNILVTFTNTTIENSIYSDTLVVIDPGHGGKDPGAIGSNIGINEKDVNLKAGLMLKKKLEAKGFKVYITRDRDEYIGLYDRANIANELSADAFVSIHFNASLNSDASGVEILYAPDSYRNNYEFALNTQRKLVNVTKRVDRGIVSRPNLVVIRETRMPAILAELGFLTNYNEEKLINSNSYLDRATEGLLRGIIEQIE